MADNKRPLEDVPVTDEASEAKKPKLETSEAPQETSPLAQRNSSQRGGRGGRGGRGSNYKGKAIRRDYAPREPKTEQDDGEKRLPKRKVCVLIGYCGTGLSGSQINPGVKTVEGEIFQALVKAGCVSEDNSVNPAKVALARSARTDAGVHAAVNALSLKLIVQPPGLPEPKELGTLVDYVNSFLPDHLRIWSITRVQGAFNPRGMCDSRCYDYLLPTYVFLPPKPDSAMGKALVEAGLSPFSDYQAKEGEPISLANVEASQFWSAVSQLPAVPTPENEEEESYFKQTMALKRQWRIGNSSTVLDDLKAATKLYEGNHNFHNFTIGMEFNSRSAIRIMKSLKISDPFIVGDSEWISIKIHGQSFMLHQIRKMMGMLILVTRSRTPASLIPEAFGPSKIHVPKSPSLGLLLEKPIFETYNGRVEDANKQMDALAARKSKKSLPPSAATDGEDFVKKDKLDYGPEFEVQVDKFKQQFIYDKLYAEERDHCSFAKFLNLLDLYKGPDFGYLNAKGTIPTSCVFVNGKIPGSSTDQLNKDEAAEEDALVPDADEG